MASCVFVLRIVDGLELFALAFGIVGDDELDRIKNSAHAGGALVEILAHGSLQKGHVVESIKLSIAYFVNKLNNTFW